MMPDFSFSPIFNPQFFRWVKNMEDTVSTAATTAKAEADVDCLGIGCLYAEAGIAL